MELCHLTWGSVKLIYALFGLGRGGGGDRKLVIIGLDSGLKGSG